jgi:hypothetical protein
MQGNQLLRKDLRTGPLSRSVLPLCRSLLVFHNQGAGSWRHYDSGGPGGGARPRPNAEHARALQQALSGLITPRTAPAATGTISTTAGLSSVSQPPAATGAGAAPLVLDVPTMPCQQNGYDCGVYVCAVAQALVHWRSRWSSVPRVAGAGCISREEVAGKCGKSLGLVGLPVCSLADDFDSKLPRALMPCQQLRLHIRALIDQLLAEQPPRESGC